MDTPDGEFYPGFFQGLSPSQHMLVDAVDERAIKIE
jgi:hypothetical protein